MKRADFDLPVDADRVHRLAAWLFHLRGSPEAIAGGVAIGIVVALTPTLGVQSVLAAFLATVLNANRPAAMAMVWITNPLTVAPVFGVTYAVGAWLLALPGAGQAEEAAAVAAHVASSQGPGSLALHMVVPLLVGGLLIGCVLGVGAYVTVLRLVRSYRASHPRGARRRTGGFRRVVRRPA